MGTSAIIKIEGVDFACVYKHWDGYPENTQPWLAKFNAEFARERGDDPGYKFAQLLRDSVRRGSEFELDDSKYTGWGVLPADEDAGQEYEYTLHRDGTVTVQDVGALRRAMR